jgi:hypothetical protein
VEINFWYSEVASNLDAIQGLARPVAGPSLAFEALIVLRARQYVDSFPISPKFGLWGAKTSSVSARLTR